VVLAAYDVDRTTAVLRDLLLRTLSSGHCRAVVVANSEAALNRLSQLVLPPELTVIAGSNEVGEFSAYEEGLDQLRSQHQLPETIVLLNDRAMSYGDDYRGVLKPYALAAVRALPMVSGSIESFHHPVLVSRSLLHTWCRTNFMLMSREALHAVGSIVSVGRAEFDSIVPTGFPGDDWTPASWLGSEYTQLVLRWLSVPGNWYRAEPLSGVNWQSMRLKILAIINEHLFSIRAMKHGIPLIGYKQLAQLEALRGRPTTFSWVIGQYLSSPFMADDRERSPAFRLFQVAAVWAGVAGLDRTAMSLVRHSIRQHTRDWDRIARHRAL